MWFSWLTAVGDASGGDQTLIIEFDPLEIANLSGRYFNIEALELSNNNNSQRGPAALHLINFAPVIATATINRQWTIEILLNNLGNNAITLGNKLVRPIFLGTPVLATVTASIRAVIDNVDTVDTTMWAEGYIWSGRSVMAQGGLRRPQDSLYG